MPEQQISNIELELTDFWLELEDGPEEIAPDVVRARIHVHAIGIRSGIVIDAPCVAIMRFRDGRTCSGWGSYDLEGAEAIADAISRGEEVEL